MIAVKIDGISYVNIYKPPSSNWSNDSLTLIPGPSIIAGDFNSKNQIWGYDQNDADGEFIFDWMSNNGFELIFDAKDTKTFHSAVCRTEKNPDLVFISSPLATNNITEREVL